jgi:hypothetical protein
VNVLQRPKGLPLRDIRSWLPGNRTLVGRQPMTRRRIDR